METLYRLLIVDDEYIERCALRYIIENNCPQISLIEEASNGREAISKASSFHPDIIIIDIKMPGINGIEASKEIKKTRPNCRIVFLTAFDYFDHAQEAIKIGAEDFIVKPAPNEQVAETVDRIVERLNSERDKDSKRAELENKLEQIKNYLELELINSIVEGDIEEGQIKEYLSAMGVEFKSGFGAAVNINYDSYFQKITSPLQKNMIKKRCMEKIKSAVEERGLSCIMNHINNCIYLLVIVPPGKSVDEPDTFSTGLFKDVCAILDQQLWVKADTGIGCFCHSLGQITGSFTQAGTALSSADDSSNVVHASHIKQGSGEVIYAPDRVGVLIEKVKEYIEKNYMKDISLDEMAEMVGLSSFYFSKIFKQYKDVNFIDYLTSVRIEKAKELLVDPMINIKEISSMVGYSDPNYFTRVFKKMTGTAPTEYRSKKMLLSQ